MELHLIKNKLRNWKMVDMEEYKKVLKIYKWHLKNKEHFKPIQNHSETIYIIDTLVLSICKYNLREQNLDLI